MKTIKLNEAQASRLFEDDGDSIFLDGNDSTRQFGSEVSNQQLVDTENGEQEYSNPIDSEKYAKMQSPQQWGAVGRRNSTNEL